MHILRPQPSSAPRAGFTLIELLTVIAIIILLLTMTVLAVNYSAEAERVRGSANEIQSFLSGALDRAIFQRNPVGVRLFLDNTQFTDESEVAIAGNRRTVSALALIEPAPAWTDGKITLLRWDGDNDTFVDPITPAQDINGDGITGDDPALAWVVQGTDGVGWWELKRRGLLRDDLRIRIPRGSGGTWYQINTSLIDVTVAPTGTDLLILKIPYGQSPTVVGNTPVDAFIGGGPSTYELELPPTIVPTEARLLAEGIVIDLDGSKIPSVWGPNLTAVAGASEYSQFMDIMFSPRGGVIGSAASEGLIHLYVCEGADSIRLKEHYSLLNNPAQVTPDLTGFRTWLDSLGSTNEFAQLIPADVVSLDEPDDFPVSDRRLVTIFTQTGAVTVSPVDPTDANDNGLADDPYLFAEVGSESN